ncbi:PulJ/GspJ family protein [Bacillaceae bacterium W0354]
MKNERGITLVEVLAALILVFVIGSLAFSVTTTTYENYNQSELRTSAHRQVNLFFSHLTNIHQRAQSYTIKKINESTIEVDITYSDGRHRVYTFDGKPFLYKLQVEQNGVMVDVDNEWYVDLTTTRSLTINLKVSQPSNNRFRPIEIKTNLYRITPAKSGD